ncbi:Gfo/Idh/MocA family oxidoreductase [Candidatus Poribacteria bacterium]|nr:Gfo/Idh/MocA family oxidoreductase [Candidatus Poribacteria bacterium]MYH79717.1 Gfo/Idh/MocA family oxidoreductase [Candidatus Poribacteria bacterium]MYK97226.1 Gfo/Idh/MocA family oxidoreductase [Candidatus Poribacteria bacterium]
MADTQEFGIGLIGLGIGQQHLLGYQRRDLHVAAICDKDVTRLNEVGNAFGINKRYTRIADLIADTDVDVVDMAVQPWIRSPIVKAAAEAGKHILCQKPFSMSMQQAIEMVNICERHNVQLMVNQNSCFVPGFLAIEPYINAEHLGEIYHVSITCNGFYTEFPERHLIPAMQVHHIGLVYKWFGEYESVYCQAHGHNRSIEEGETVSTALFKSRSGVQGLLSCNWAFLANPGRNLQHPHEEIRIQGTKGAIYGNSDDMTVHLTEPETREIKPSIDGTWFPDAFGNVMAHFLACLQTGKKPITDGRSNLHVVQTIFAMHQSARSGKVVLLDDISLNGDYDLSPHPVHSANDTSILQ